jgi:hypothetical protein
VDALSLRYVPKTLKFAAPKRKERGKNFHIYGVDPLSVPQHLHAPLGQAHRFIQRAGLAAGGRHHGRSERDGITSFRFPSARASRRFAAKIRNEIPNLDYEHTPVQTATGTHHDIDIYHQDHLLPAVTRTHRALEKVSG